MDECLTEPVDEPTDLKKIRFLQFLHRRAAKPYIARGYGMKNFYKSSKNALKRGRRKPEKKEEPAADIDRKQAHGGGGEIRTHVPVRTT